MIIILLEMSSLILGSSSRARRGKAFKYILSSLVLLPFFAKTSCVNLIFFKVSWLYYLIVCKKIDRLINNTVQLISVVGSATRGML